MTARGLVMCSSTSARICSLMSRGWPCVVSAICVRPGRSTSDRSGTYAEWIRRWIGCDAMHLPGPARALVCASISRRICVMSLAEGVGAVRMMVRCACHEPPAYVPNSARITPADSLGACTSCRWSGQRVTIDSPSGRMSHAMIALSRLDLPLDCVPTTTICGSSGMRKSSAGLCCSSAESVFATRRTSADESAASGEPSTGPRVALT